MIDHMLLNELFWTYVPFYLSQRKQTTNGAADTLAKSVKRRMRYFGGSPALVSLSQNGYVNES